MQKKIDRSKINFQGMGRENPPGTIGPDQPGIFLRKTPAKLAC